MFLIFAADSELPKIAMKAMDCRPAALCVSGGPGQALSPHVARAVNQLGFEVLESDAIEAMLIENGVSRSERDQLCHSEGCVAQLQDALGAFGIDYLMVGQLSVTERRAELFLTLRRQGSRANVAKDFIDAKNWEGLRGEIPALTGRLMGVLLPKNHPLNIRKPATKTAEYKMKPVAPVEPQVAKRPRPKPVTIPNAEERASIESVCKVKRVMGKKSYAACIAKKLAELEATPRPNYGETSPQEQEAMKGSCKVKKVFGPASFYRCVQKKLQALRGVHRPDYGSASEQERAWIDTTCKPRKLFGPASFYKCVKEQVTSLQIAGRPDYEGIKSQEKAWIAHTCKHSRPFGPASYYTCVHGHLNRIRMYRKP